MKRIAVCGCSFMTSSRDQYDVIKGVDWGEDFPIEETENIRKEATQFGYVHYPNFTDIYANKHCFKIDNYAKGGASNLLIRKQIDLALLNPPDFFIISATSPFRIDFMDNDGTIVTNCNSTQKDTKTYYNYYIKHISNDEIDFLKSFYIIQSGLELLKNLQIPFLFLPGPKQFSLL